MESTYEVEEPEPVAPERPEPVGLIFLEPADGEPAGAAGVCDVDGVCN